MQISLFMKYRLQLVIILLHLATISSVANDVETFEQPQTEIEFAKINELENFVLNNQGITLEKLKAEKSELVDNFTLETSSSYFIHDTTELFGIPPFLWGCCLGVIGILFVYILTDKDKAATQKAVIGCAVAMGTSVVVYFAIFVMSVLLAEPHH